MKLKLKNWCKNMGFVGNRIRGLEHEYNLQLLFKGDAEESTDADMLGRPRFGLIGPALAELHKAGHAITSDWNLCDEIGNIDFERTSIHGRLMTQNGGIVYDDMRHLEISTPSYRDPIDALICDKSAEILAFTAAKLLSDSASLKSLDFADKVIADKSNMAKDALGNDVSYATHGNVLVSRKACNLPEWNKVLRALVPYIVTRPILFGPGDFVSPALAKTKGLKFVISPRAFFIRKITSNDTVFARGLINERDEPHANHDWFRLHDHNLEGIRSIYQTILRDAFQSLTISALERGLLYDAPVLEQPVSTMQEISADTTEMNWKVVTKGGEKTDAPSILRYYLSKIEEMSPEFDDLDKAYFGLLSATVGILEQRSTEKLVDGLDWITLRDLLTIEEPRNVTEAKSLVNQFKLIDESVLHYLGKTVDIDACDSYFDPRESIAFAKSKMPWIRWDKLPQMMQHGISNPPDDTRDYFRTNFIKRFMPHVTGFSWGKIYLDGYNSIILDQPFMLQKKESESMLNGSKSLEQVLLEVQAKYPGSVQKYRDFLPEAKQEGRAFWESYDEHYGDSENWRE